MSSWKCVENYRGRAIGLEIPSSTHMLQNKIKAMDSGECDGNYCNIMVKRWSKTASSVGRIWLRTRLFRKQIGDPSSPQGVRKPENSLRFQILSQSESDPCPIHHEPNPILFKSTWTQSGPCLLSIHPENTKSFTESNTLTRQNY